MELILTGLFCSLAATLASPVSPAVDGAIIRTDLRPDGVPVVLLPPGLLDEELKTSYPFQKFPGEFVKEALNSSVDWRTKGAVTPAKDQGAHGYCGTFGRVAAAEGQYALRSNRGLRNFSEEELVDCIGWDKDQFGYFRVNGFIDSADYPYDTTGPDMDPPIPDHPCLYGQKEVIKGTAFGNFTNSTGRAPDEQQLAAFIYKNGPVQTGINANVFGMRAKGCEATGDCFITEEMCNDPSIKGKGIDHSITLVGYGTHAVHGDYWIVKNSWSTKFANQGFIYVARGISCAQIDCCGNVYTYGDPASYYKV